VIGSFDGSLMPTVYKTPVPQPRLFTMSVWTIIVLCIAAAGLYFFFPKMPRLAQIVVAIIGCIVCLLVLANALGVSTGLHF
jgi:hypothetical protein